MPTERLQQVYLPLLQSAYSVSTDERQSFSVLICAESGAAAEVEKERLSKAFDEPYLPQVVSSLSDDGAENSIVFDTVTFAELCDTLSCETFEKLLRSDFLLWFEDGECELEDVIPIAAACGDLFWLVTKEEPKGKELYEVADGFCHALLGGKGCCKQDVLARSLHGLICIKGGEIRRNFRRHAIKLCCEQGKKEIREEIAVWQEKRNQRFLQQMMYYYKFLRHWNSLDNGLSENGDYYRLMKEPIEKEERPDTFGKRMTEMVREKSKEFFETWQNTFLHSIGWSRVCQRMKDDFYRVVLNLRISDAVVVGEEPIKWSDRLLGRKPAMRYNRYREQALSEIRHLWIPALREQAKRFLAEYEAEYRGLIKTYDEEWQDLSEVYLQILKIQKQLPDEQLR